MAFIYLVRRIPRFAARAPDSFFVAFALPPRLVFFFFREAAKLDGVRRGADFVRAVLDLPLAVDLPLLAAEARSRPLFRSEADPWLRSPALRVLPPILPDSLCGLLLGPWTGIINSL